MNASKMTIITGLKYEVVETMGTSGRIRVSSFSLDGFKKPILGEDIAPDSVCCRDYYVRGRRICTPNGKEVFLGNAPEVEEFLGLQFDLIENLKREKEEALNKLSKAEKEKSGVLFKLSKMQQRVEELERGTLEWAKAYSSLLSELVESLKRTIAWAKAYSSLQSELLKRLRQLRGGESLFGRLKYLFTGELV